MIWRRHLAACAGYVGRVSEVSPICYSDPGMTNTNMQFAVVDVDADAPENQNVNPELEVCVASDVLQIDCYAYNVTINGHMRN